MKRTRSQRPQAVQGRGRGKVQGLTGTLLHAGGAEAVLPFGVDIHLVGGGVVQHERRAGVLACGLITEPAADLCQEEQDALVREQGCQHPGVGAVLLGCQVGKPRRLREPGNLSASGEPENCS